MSRRRKTLSRMIVDVLDRQPTPRRHCRPTLQEGLLWALVVAGLAVAWITL